MFPLRFNFFQSYMYMYMHLISFIKICLLYADVKNIIILIQI